MIEVKQAAAIASNYMSEVLGATDLALEEVECSEDDRFWDITLSGLVPSASRAIASPSLAAFLGHRTYKIFRVDAERGIVKSMKIRNTE